MSEILQALEFQARAQGNAETASPVVDMRSARLQPESSGNSDSTLLPQATVTADHIDLGDSKTATPAVYTLDDDNDEGFTVKNLLTQLLEFPGPTDGIVPDSWGTDQRAEVKHVSPLMDSIYTLDRRVHNVVNSIRDDILEIHRNRST